MIVNKEKRITYIGFDDTWFLVFGIIILSFVTDYLFTNSFYRYPFGVAIWHWSISLFFSAFNWFIMRFNLIFLRKKFPEIKDIGKRVTLVFLAIVLTVTLVDGLGNIVVSQILGEEYYHPLRRVRILLPIILISTMVIAIYEAMYNYVRLKNSIREEEQAKQMIVQAQLDTLRNQAQPHFLFNSLNTLRDIIDQNPKEDAKKFVDKLSDVYRFILEAGNVNLTPLSHELRFAKAYIHIQSERFGSNLKLQWAIPDTVLHQMVAPMSLQLLLENAIKHNVISKAKPLIIEVKAMNGYLEVGNKIQLKSTQLPSTKLGLRNIEKRYALISSTPIKVENDGKEFKVSIPLLKTTDKKH
ncbi:sensor histidine kinase [Spongiimicrobium salis]|uniref:sensor histidine kinase n=1 Tax=Spongiimicrobium salis TaxID=1667022 RepID=UPI00374D708E